MKRPKMPSPAMTVACLALAIALSGVSYAAITIPRNSVGTAQLKNNAVKGAKVKNRSLKAVDFASGQLPQGPQGVAGQNGAPGPSTGYYTSGSATVTGSTSSGSTLVASLLLPAGSFVVTATARVDNLGGDMEELRCRLDLAGLSDEKAVYLGGANPTDIDVLAFTVANTQGSSSPAKVLCFQNGGTLDGVSASATITAVKVATLN